MGIVISQSIKNTISTYIGFAIGAVNTLFLYTNFLGDTYFGLVAFVLSVANVMMPLLMFGVNNTLIKFFSTFKSRQNQQRFLTLMLFLPLLMIIPLTIVGVIGYETITLWLSKKNAIIKNYTYLIFIVAIAMAYFEIFFAWSKVHFKSVFGNVMKEIFHRVCVFVLLFAVYFKFLSPEQFIYAVVAVYIFRMLLMMGYAFSVYAPKLDFKFSFDVSAVLKYSVLIVIAGSVAILMLDLDKFMLGQLVPIEQIAYYNVAVFIATVIAVPARAMHQISHPLTAKLLNDKNSSELNNLYIRSSLNLAIVSGLITVLIVCNINSLYTLLPEAYSQALYVVLAIAFVKFLDNLLGNNNAIIFNSDYYRVILLFGVIIIVLAVVLNLVFIPKYGINGAAIATVLALVSYAILKVGFVFAKFNMQPFTGQTLKVIALMVLCCVCFYTWDFNWHPILNIAVKSVLIAMVYCGVVYRFKLSSDINAIIHKILQ